MLQCSKKSRTVRLDGPENGPSALFNVIQMEGAMNEFPTQIPAEMRDFAERSVAQARKAFEGFMGAVQKTASVDAPAFPPAAGVKDVSQKAVAFAEKNVTSAFDLAEKLVHAKDVQEVITLQTEYLQQQMAAIQEQTRELGEVVQKAAGVKK
jgi:phasin